MYVEDGCFVYQVIGEPIEVRYKPSDCDASRTRQLYSPGDMVTMDRIICSDDTQSNAGGPYLRLADGTGWLFERKDGEQTMQRVLVQTGLWSFYVGNYPEGQALLRHPTDRAELCVMSRNKALKMYDPFQKVYCDRKVQNPQTGIGFYRIQGTNGWLVDKRLGRSRSDHCHMLVEEQSVQTGLFAFQAVNEVGIQGLPKLGEESLTGGRLRRGDICVADTVYQPTSLGPHDGPFIHLTDGSGWVKEMENTVQLLRRMDLQAGLWTVSVLNPPHGLYLYRQPVSHTSQEPPEQLEDRQDDSASSARDSNYWVTLTENEVRISLPHQVISSRLSNIHKSDTHYEPGTTLECDWRLSNGGVKYYRVKGTKGWIADRMATGEKVLQVDKKESSATNTSTTSHGGGWTVEFVRGAAAVIKGMQELVHSEDKDAITFRSGKGIRVHVYYASRTVGITKDDPAFGKTQLFCRDCSNEELGQILLDPPLDAGSQRRYGRRRNNEQLVEHSADRDDSISLTEEEGYRNELLDVEQELNRIREKEHELLQKIKEYDGKRCKAASARRHERRVRTHELEKAHKEINLLVQEKVKEIAQRQEVERIQRQTQAEKDEQKRKLKLELTCLECYQTFRSARKRDEHCIEQHGLHCEQCGKVFRSSQALDEHCIRRGHY